MSSSDIDAEEDWDGETSHLAPDSQTLVDHALNFTSDDMIGWWVEFEDERGLRRISGVGLDGLIRFLEPRKAPCRAHIRYRFWKP
jgi:hypothetical protein